MTTVGIRELQRDTSAIVERVARTQRPTFVTNRGEPVAVVMPVDTDGIDDFVLANAPTFVRAMRHADADVAAGRVRSADEVFAELDAGAPEPAEGSPRLTSRELEVLRFVAEGWTRAEIASTLEIRESTVRSHLAHIVEKLDATT
jgi:prevent-host-death family protein